MFNFHLSRIIFVCLILLTGCSGSGAVSTSENDSISTAWNGLALSSSGIVLKDVNNDTSQEVLQGIETVEILSQSRDGSRLVLTYQRGDSTHLAMYTAGSHFSYWYGLPGEVSYSGAWSDDQESFAFGYASDSGNGISIADVGGADPVSVGCSASNVVMGWPESDRLLAASATGIYIVQTDGCGTIKTLDMRKKSAITVSGDGSRIAYILRELEYNRETRAYEPDSALYIASYMDENPVQIAGQRYSPKRMTWSQDGNKLAFDVSSQQAEGKRSLAIYDVESGESTFLVRPDPLGIPSESSPTWSPDGSFVIYDRIFEESGLMQKAARSLIDNAFIVLAEGEEQAEIISWVGMNSALIYHQSKFRVVPLTGMPAKEIAFGEGVFWLPVEN